MNIQISPELFQRAVSAHHATETERGVLLTRDVAEAQLTAALAPAVENLLQNVIDGHPRGEELTRFLK